MHQIFVVQIHIKWFFYLILFIISLISLTQTTVFKDFSVDALNFIMVKDIKKLLQLFVEKQPMNK